MGIVKDLYMEACQMLYAEAEESGKEIDESKIGDMAHKIVMDRFADMCDEAKDRAKYARD